MSAPIVVEVDGQPPAAGQLQHLALVNYGHFTSMQVRRGATRGLRLHLDRLDAATRELFGVGVDHDQVRHLIRHALDDIRDASVRIIVFRPDEDREPAVMVVVRPPVDAPTSPQRLRSVVCLRPVAHLKHTGSFGQIYHGLRAERDGFDDALLTTPTGTVSETTTGNIALYDGAQVVWPDAPCLPGITMKLLEPGLAELGLLGARRPVPLAELPAFAAAFTSNSLGVASVGEVDGVAVAADPDLMEVVARLYRSVPWDAL